MSNKFNRAVVVAQVSFASCVVASIASAGQGAPYSRLVQGDHSFGVYLESKFSTFALACGLPEFKVDPGFFSSAFRTTSIPGVFFSNFVERPKDTVLTNYPSIAVLHIPKTSVSTYFTAFFPSNDPQNALNDILNQQVKIDNLIDGVAESTIDYRPGSQFAYNNKCEDSLEAAEEAGVNLAVLTGSEKLVIKRNKASSIYITHATFVSPLSRFVADSVSNSVPDATKERFRWNVAAWYSVNAQFSTTPWFISEIEVASISTTLGQNAVSTIDSSAAAGVKFPLYSVGGEVAFKSKETAQFDVGTQATFVFGSPVNAKTLFPDPVTKRYYSPTTVKLSRLQSVAELKNQLAKIDIVSPQDQEVGLKQSLKQEVFVPNMSRAACRYSNFKVTGWKVTEPAIVSAAAEDAALQGTASVARDGCLITVSGRLPDAYRKSCEGAGCRMSYNLEVIIGNIALSYSISSYLMARIDLTLRTLDEQPRLSWSRTSSDVLARRFYWTIPVVFASTSKRSVDTNFVEIARVETDLLAQCKYRIPSGQQGEQNERVVAVPITVEYDDAYAQKSRENKSFSNAQLKIWALLPDDPAVNASVDAHAVDCYVSNVAVSAKVANESERVKLSLPPVQLKIN